MDAKRKENLLMLLMQILYWILCAAGTSVGVWIHGIGQYKTGAHTGNSFLQSEIIEVQPVWAVLGVLLASAVITAVWLLLMRLNLEHFFGQHRGWLAAWILIFLVCVCAHGLLTAFADLYRYGLFTVLRPDWTEIILLIPISLPLVLFAGYMLKKLIRHAKAVRADND